MKKGIVPGKAIVPGVIAYAMRIRKKTESTVREEILTSLGLTPIPGSRSKGTQMYMTPDNSLVTLQKQGDIFVVVLMDIEPEKMNALETKVDGILE
jgi:hypothetical protein